VTSAAALSRVLDHLKRTPGLPRDTAVVAGLVVLGLASGGYILSQQRVAYPWDDSFTFAAEFEEAPGISPGNGQEVRMAGVTVGDIVAADVTDDGTARLTLKIDQDRASRVYDNARLVLRPKSPLNEMYVEVAPGGAPGAPLAEGAVIPASQTEDPEQVDEVLQHLDEESRTALGSLLAESDAALASASVALPPGLEAADGTLTSLRPVVEQLATRRESLRQLVTALSDIASAAGADDARLARLVSDARATLAVLGRNRDELDASLGELPGVTDELRRATTAVDALTAELDPALDGLRAASTELPDALGTLRSTVQELDGTLDAAAPVLQGARPLVADLRPVVADLRPILSDVRAVTARADVATAQLVDYLPDLQDFVYNTTSVTSLEDANGGILRGLFQFSQTSVPAELPRIDEGTQR
jgi:phospholipid/cholesterol/gamma-HCH transport system substrate-binding protein